MKRLLYVFFIVGLLAIQSCNKDVSCFSAPNPINFVVLDSITSENLVCNRSSQVSFVNIETNNNIEFEILNVGDNCIIQISSVGWETEKLNLKCTIGKDPIFEIDIDAERLYENSCSYTNYRSIEIRKAIYDWDPQTNIYTIKV